jgi:hypothetical protein
MRLPEGLRLWIRGYVVSPCNSYTAADNGQELQTIDPLIGRKTYKKSYTKAFNLIYIFFEQVFSL